MILTENDRLFMGMKLAAVHCKKYVLVFAYLVAT